MRLVDYLALLLLGALWGASFLFIRIAAPVFGPTVLIFLRLLIAGLVLIGIVAIQRDMPDLRQRWKMYLILGTLNAAIPMVLLSFAVLTIEASLSAILNATVPLFTAIIAAVWIGETLTIQKIGGVILGIIGVTVLIGGAPFAFDMAFIIAVAASLIASAFYGVGTVYASRHLTGGKPIHNSIGQLMGACVFLIFPATFTMPDALPTQGAVLALLALAVLSTSLAYLLYFFLLNNIGATRTTTVTFLVPVFSVIWATIFLDEVITPVMIVGMAIILSSVGLVLGAKYQATAKTVDGEVNIGAVADASA